MPSSNDDLSTKSEDSVIEKSEDSAIEFSEGTLSSSKKRKSGTTIGMLQKLKSLPEGDFLKYVGKGIETTKKTISDTADLGKKKKKRRTKKTSDPYVTTEKGRTNSLTESGESTERKNEEEESFNFKYNVEDDSFLESPSESPPGSANSSFSPRKDGVLPVSRSNSSSHSRRTTSDDAAGRRGKLLQRYASTLTETSRDEALTSLSEAEDPHASRISGSNKKFHKRFKLPDEVVIDDYLCALLLRGALLAQGSMYITHNYVCFYANIFGKVTRVAIPFTDIISVRKCKILKSIPNSIEIHTVRKKYFWASFLHREAAFQLIDKRWRLLRQKMGCPVIDEVRPLNEDDTDWSVSDPKGDLGYDWQDEEEIEDPFTNTNETIPPTEPDCCHQIFNPNTKESPRYYEKFPLSIKEFYLHFLSDGSEEFWNAFHDKVGYEDFTMTKWKPSLENCCLERSVDFVVPIKISLGPKSTRVTQKQRCRFVNENEIIFETSSHSHDVIKANEFLVNAIWIIKRSIGGCDLSIYVSVKFTKKNWLNFMIKHTAIEGSRDWFDNWLLSASAFANQLKLDLNVPHPLRSSKTKLLRRSLVSFPTEERKPVEEPSSNLNVNTPKDTNSQSKIILISLLVLLFTLFCTTFYYYYQSSTLNNNIDDMQQQIQSLQEELNSLRKK